MAGDIFHKEKAELTDLQQVQLREIKEKAEELVAVIEGVYNAHVANLGLKVDDVDNIDLTDSEAVEKKNAEIALFGEVERCKKVAITNLESSVMWAVKGLTKGK